LREKTKRFKTVESFMFEAFGERPSDLGRVQGIWSYGFVAGRKRKRNP
jgi:hypothetical protein